MTKTTRKRTKIRTGDVLRIVREEQGISQEKLAKLSKVNQSRISMIEHHKSKIGIAVAEKLASALRIHPSVLVWPQWEG